ncbi:MAG: MBL fold metallo-hydrolase [Micropruina sp.]|nr:MBL fold metallo-hydrolase [Micropruina sp.]
MKKLAPGVFQLARTIGANCYLIDTGDGLILIDPGMTMNLNQSARDLRANGLSPYSVKHLLLTHYDYDHAQGAAEWARRTGATVWVGAADAEIMRHTAPIPHTPFRRLTARAGIAELPENAELIDGDSEIVHGIRALPTPGHTPGHLAFVLGEVAFIGDAAMVNKKGVLGPMPAFLDADVHQAAASRMILNGLTVSTICAGHSTPFVAN